MHLIVSLVAAGLGFALLPASVRNLQRPVNQGYLREWAEHFRAPQDDGARHDSSCVAFRIGREWLALPTGMFQQIAPKAVPHRLPHRSARGLRGVVNAGGKLYPCISLAEPIFRPVRASARCCAQRSTSRCGRPSG